MKKIYFLFIPLIAFLFCDNCKLNAQGGVSINAAGSTPDPSAMLDVNSTIKGQLMPRMTTAQRNAIVSPAKGLFIYNTDCDVVNYNAGTPGNPNWATMSASNVLTASVSIAANPIGAICAGSSVTFTATPGQNNLSPTYQWQVNGNNVGSNSTTYSTSSLNSGDVVTCVLTSSVNCITGSPATSNSITMLVNTVPFITGTNPTSFCSGSAVTLGASASLGAVNWYTDSTGGSSLLTGSYFTVSGLTATTTYYVDANANGCTTASRTPVTATFYPNAPSEPGAISGRTYISAGDTASYSISALSNVASYAWTVYPPGVITSGQGTTSIRVTWGDSVATAAISVASTNPCGTSVAQTLTIYVGTETFNASDSLLNGVIQSFTVPPHITSVTIDAFGAQGGSGNGGYGSRAYGCNCSYPGGKGAEIKGTFNVNPGDVIQVLVGQAGGSYGGPYGNENGGGGGSFVYNQTSATLLIAAGGGGGGPSTAASGEDQGCSRTPSDGDGQAGASGISPSCPQCGCGSGTGGSGGSGGSASGSIEGGAGGGYTGNGQNGGTHCAPAYGGLSYINGATGGLGNTCYDPTGTQNAGGYGGGGGGTLSGPGGGGGYSGGGSLGDWSTYSTWGGGGGSYNAGSNPTNTSGVETGHGKVTFNW